jgi:hypothetical protein
VCVCVCFYLQFSATLTNIAKDIKITVVNNCAFSGAAAAECFVYEGRRREQGYFREESSNLFPANFNYSALCGSVACTICGNQASISPFAISFSTAKETTAQEVYEYFTMPVILSSM